MNDTHKQSKFLVCIVMLAILFGSMIEAIKYATAGFPDEYAY